MAEELSLGAVEKVLADIIRPSAIKLMAGEMAAGETRTALAVANGIASKVRAALAADHTEEGLRLRMIDRALNDTNPDLSWHDRQNIIRNILKNGGGRDQRTAAAGSVVDQRLRMVHEVDAILAKPPEPVSHPNEAWCEQYAEWHDGYAVARARVLGEKN